MDNTTITLISVGASAAVSLIVCFFGYKQNFSQNYSGTISKERMAWIKETRKLVAEFLGFCEANEDINDKKAKKRFYRLKNEILLNLNLNGDKYQNDRTIRKILIDNQYPVIRDKVPDIRDAFAKIFKDEWDKAKLEAGRSFLHALMLDIKEHNLKGYFKLVDPEPTSDNNSEKGKDCGESTTADQAQN